jgi:hypothetical protein
MDEATGRVYAESVRATLSAGLNFIDTSLNYRSQTWERAVGTALREAVDDRSGARPRDRDLHQGRPLVPDAIPQRAITARYVAAGMQFDGAGFSRRSIESKPPEPGVETIDVAMHYPEIELSYVTQDEFCRSMLLAFIFLEEPVEQDSILRNGQVGNIIAGIAGGAFV